MWGRVPADEPLPVMVGGADGEDVEEAAPELVAVGVMVTPALEEDVVLRPLVLLIVSVLSDLLSLDDASDVDLVVAVVAGVDPVLAVSEAFEFEALAAFDAGFDSVVVGVFWFPAGSPGGICAQAEEMKSKAAMRGTSEGPQLARIRSCMMTDAIRID